VPQPFSAGLAFCPAHCVQRRAFRWGALMAAAAILSAFHPIQSPLSQVRPAATWWRGSGLSFSFSPCTWKCRLWARAFRMLASVCKPRVPCCKRRDHKRGSKRRWLPQQSGTATCRRFGSSVRALQTGRRRVPAHAASGSVQPSATGLRFVLGLSCKSLRLLRTGCKASGRMTTAPAWPTAHWARLNGLAKLKRKS
jgi:hypothetical protein